MTDTHFDAIIVGGGAAGLSAAQALGRSLRRTLVIDAGEPRNRFASRMHNVLGNDGVTPADLLERGRSEAAAYGVEFAAGNVAVVRDRGSHLEVELAASGTPAAPQPTVLTTRALVVASGVHDDLPSIPGLAQYWGSTVLHCPYCHGWEVRGGKLAVLATSPASIHQVMLLRQWSDDVTVFGAALGDLEADTKRALLARGMRIVNEPVTEVIGDDARVTGVRTADGAHHDIDAIFTMSKVQPRDRYLGELELARAEGPFGSFLAVDATGRTSHNRVWAVGNVSAPMATVPMVMGAGAGAGGAINFALLEEDFALAVQDAR